METQRSPRSQRRRFGIGLLIVAGAQLAFLALTRIDFGAFSASETEAPNRRVEAVTLEDTWNDQPLEIVQFQSEQESAASTGTTIESPAPARAAERPPQAEPAFAAAIESTPISRPRVSDEGRRVTLARVAETASPVVTLASTRRVVRGVVKRDGDAAAGGSDGLDFQPGSEAARAAEGGTGRSGIPGPGVTILGGVGGADCDTPGTTIIRPGRTGIGGFTGTGRSGGLRGVIGQLRGGRGGAGAINRAGPTRGF